MGDTLPGGFSNIVREEQGSRHDDPGDGWIEPSRNALKTIKANVSNDEDRTIPAVAPHGRRRCRNRTHRVHRARALVD